MHIHSRLMILSVTGLLLAAAGCSGGPDDPRSVDTTKTPTPTTTPSPTPTPSPVTICQPLMPAPGPGPDAQRLPLNLPVGQDVSVQYGTVLTKQHIAGDPQPCLFTHAVPMSMKVSRDGGQTVDYTVWAGPLSENSPRSGSFLFDRSDWSLPANHGIASISLHQGWGMMIRHHGYPPLRTIRVTTGRPRLHLEFDAAATLVKPATASKLQYAILGIIQPDATDDSGLEYFFMGKANPGEETKITLVSISDVNEKADLISGQYVAFDRQSGKFGKVAALPELKELEEASFRPFVKEAVCAAYKASGEKFFSGGDEKCN